MYQYAIDRSDFEYSAMDTDSAYIAVSGECIEDLARHSVLKIFRSFARKNAL